MVQTSPQPQKDVIQVDLEEEQKEASKEEKVQNVAITLSFHKLMSYADSLDWTLMALGTLGSVVHGMAQPIGYLLLGKALNAFGDNINDTSAMVTALYKVLLSLFFLFHFYYKCTCIYMMSLFIYYFVCLGCSICMVHGIRHISSWNTW